MNDKILESYISDFADRHALADSDLPHKFMHFVNHCVVTRSTADSFDVLEVCTDGDGDNGIDGFALLVEGHVVTTEEDITYFREKLGRLNAEFVFVQSKSGGGFSTAEIQTFLFGVRAFFGLNAQLSPKTSAEVQDAHALKEDVYRHTIDMERPPMCSLYYASAGEWRNDPHVMNAVESDLAVLRNSTLFSQVRFVPLDASKLRLLYRSIRNKTVCEITFDKHTILPDISGIKEAYLGILPCKEYLKLIADPDGQIQRGLFYDNVRDFQGLNPVNQEIAQTLSDVDRNSQFVLLNNGVTVVAKDVTRVGAKFKITDYQIVNGCQTSHVIYMNRARVTDDVFLPFKLVVTDNADVTNNVIRATNRQTEVKAEAFESLSPFHRVLEDYYNTFREPLKRMYYERRSNQYVSTPVDPAMIVTLTMQSKAFLAMFLDSPHSTHRYYGEILNSNRGRMFQESHRPHPYYASAYALKRITTALHSGQLHRRYGKFKYHLLLLLRIISAGKDVPGLSTSRMDQYCEKIYEVLWDDKALNECLHRACGSLDRALKAFGGDGYLAPRLRDFTAELLPYTPERTRGVVKYYNADRGFGFITVDGHEDVFVHHSGVRNRQYAALQINEHVDFDVVAGERGPQARDLVIVSADQRSPSAAAVGGAT